MTDLIRNGTFDEGLGEWEIATPTPAEMWLELDGHPDLGCAEIATGEWLTQILDRPERAGRHRFTMRVKTPITIGSGTLTLTLTDGTMGGFGVTEVFSLPHDNTEWILYTWDVYIDALPRVYLNLRAEGLTARVDTVSLELLPIPLCDQMVEELQKRRRDPATVRHPELRYKEVIAQAVAEAPIDLWPFRVYQTYTESGRHWYAVPTVGEIQQISRVFIMYSGGQKQKIGRWIPVTNDAGRVFVYLDEAHYDGCSLRVEYRERPVFVCDETDTLTIDREWVLCYAHMLLLMEADLLDEDPQLVERDLLRADARRAGREKVAAQRRPPGKARAMVLKLFDGQGAGTCPEAAEVAAPPEAAFTATPVEGVNSPLTVQFTSTSTGQGTEYYWEFGDGATSYEANPSHTYYQAGVYTVSLTVADLVGRTDTELKINYISVGLPVAAFTASPRSGVVPLAVEFQNGSTGDIVYYFWEFGDGGVSSARAPVYTYQQAGTYTVTLTVTGMAGQSTKIQSNYITVSAAAAPVAEFTGSPLSLTAPDYVKFVNLSTGASSYLWDFGDGETSEEVQPSHTYTTIGLKTVTLTATGAGGVDVETKTDYVDVTAYKAPIAEFTAAPLTGGAPLTVQFTNATQYGATYSWDFGDLSPPSTDENPSHEYASDGTYDVELTATGPGGVDVETKVGYIVVTTDTPPVAAFSGTPLSGDAPLAVQFTNASTDATSYYWQFGDGATSTEEDPEHTYTVQGSYEVRLSAVGPGGFDDEVKADYVTVTSSSVERVTDALVVLYEFLEASGAQVLDTGNHGTPLHLTIDDVGRVTRAAGTLTINQEVTIQSTGAAGKISDAIKSSGEFTLEAWAAPSAVMAASSLLAPLFSYSDAAGLRNVTLEQYAQQNKIRTRLVNTSNPWGDAHDTPQDSVPVGVGSVHMAVTFDGLTLRFYKDGSEIHTDTEPDGITGWDGTMPLVMANKVNGGNPWIGILDLGAIYSKALSPAEVLQNYNAGTEIPAGAQPPAPPTPTGDTYYVSTDDGNDAYPGSKTAPVATLTHAVTLLSPGDLLYVRSGTYHETLALAASGTAVDRLMIVGFPGEPAPIIDGQHTLPGGAADLTDPISGREAVYSPLFYVTGDYWHIYGLTFTRSRGRAVQDDGATGTIIQNCTAYDCRYNAIQTELDTTDLLVDWVTAYDVGNFAQYVQGRNPATLPWGNVISLKRSTGSVVKRSIVHSSWCEGIGMAGSDDVTVEDCTIYDTGYTALYGNNVDGATFQRNLVYMTKTNADLLKEGEPPHGIMLATEDWPPSAGRLADVIIVNNIVVGTSGNLGYAVENASDIDRGGFMGCRLEHNTLVEATAPQSPSWGACLFVNPNLTRPTTGTIIRNNLILQDSMATQIARVPSSSSITYTSQLWSRTPPTAAQGSGDVTDDPELVDPDHALTPGLVLAEFYKLLATSPARGAATAIVVLEDYWTTARTTRDIGAHEYGS